MGGRESDRVATEGTAEAADPCSVHQLGTSRDGGEWKSSRHRLGRDQDVGDDARVLDGEQLARAAKAGLNLVGDQENAVTGRELTQLGQELPGRNHEPPFAQHRLHDDRGHVFCGHVALEVVLDRIDAGHGTRGVFEVVGAAIAVRVGRAVDLGRERAEAHLVGMHLGGETQGEQRTAVEPVLEGQDRFAARRRARHLDRVLDRLGPGVGEERLLREVAGHEGVQPLRETDVVLVGSDVEARVSEAFELRRGSLDHGLVGVPDIDAADASGEIDEAIAVHVDEQRAARLLHEDRRDVEGPARDGCFAPGEQLPGFRAGDRGLQLDGAHGPSPSRGLGRNASISSSASRAVWARLGSGSAITKARRNGTSSARCSAPSFSRAA